MLHSLPKISLVRPCRALGLHARLTIVAVQDFQYHESLKQMRGALEHATAAVATFHFDETSALYSWLAPS